MTPLPLLDQSELEQFCTSGQCGACCTEVGYPPFVLFDEQQDKDWARLNEEQKQAIYNHIDSHSHLPDGTYGTPCLWYDDTTHRCKNYDLRPKICREFQVGSDSCNSMRLVVLMERKLHATD